MINGLLLADAVVGTELGKPGLERISQRNRYQNRELDTGVSKIDVAIPKVRSGTYFPE